MNRTIKHLVLTLAILAGLATAVGVVAYQVGGDSRLESALHEGDALAWLREEFKLTEDQFTQIKSLHDAYSGECEEHCRAIQQATRARSSLAGTADAAALADAEARLEALREQCETAIAAHIRRCAAEMSPAAAERYLAMMLPRIAAFDHRAAPDLQLNGHRH